MATRKKKSTNGRKKRSTKVKVKGYSVSGYSRKKPAKASYPRKKKTTRRRKKK